MANILFFVSSMEGGGAERVAALLANSWASRGHHVNLIPTYSRRGKCNHKLAAEVELTFLADLIGSTRPSLTNRIKRLLAIRRLIRESQADAVVSFLSTVNIAVLAASLGLPARVVVSERIYPPQQPLGWMQSWLRARLYPTAAAVVMQTKKGADWLARAIPRCHSTVIYNPVVYPLPASHAPQLPPDKIVDMNTNVLLGVGRLIQRKGFDKLVQAFADAAQDQPTWQLVILGEGPQRATLEALVKRLGLEHRVQLPGLAGNLADWYARADLFVLNSHYEGFPNVLAEAMSYGLPVISTACDTGPDEMIEPGVNGLLLPEADPHSSPTAVAELGAALASLMTDADQRKRLGDAAKNVTERFAIEHICHAWEQVLGIGAEHEPR